MRFVCDAITRHCYKDAMPNCCWHPQVEDTRTVHQVRMVHHRQTEGMLEHKLTAAIPLATTMVLRGFKLEVVV